MKSAIRGSFWARDAFARAGAGCEEADETSSVTISPESVYLALAEASGVAFTASGGVGDDSGSVGDANLWAIFVADETAIYKSTTTAGLITVMGVGEDGESATAAITQESRTRGGGESEAGNGKNPAPEMHKE